MLKRYTRFLLISLLLAGTHAVHAQKNFRPGYVVRLNGDTLRGEVDVRGEQRMAALCLFRSGSETTRYAPTELKAFGLQGGARYEACPVPVGAAGATPPVAPASPAVLFMQVLAQGRAMLYSYTDERDRVRYCFRGTDGAVSELIETTQIVETNTAQRVQERTFPFRQVLSRAFVDCPAVQNMLIKATLKDSQLTAIFNRYNTCGAGYVPGPPTAARVTTIRVGLVGGLQRASTALNDQGEEALQSNFRPVVGLGLLVHPAAFNPKLALRLEFLYQSQLYKKQYQRNNGAVATLNSNRTAAINLKTVRIPLMLRYTLPTGKLRPYLQAGVELSVSVDTDGAQISEENQWLGGSYYTLVTPIELRRLGLGPSAGVGLLVPTGAGAVQLEARIGQLDNVSRAFDRLFGPRTVSLLLGYNLGR